MIVCSVVVCDSTCLGLAIFVICLRAGGCVVHLGVDLAFVHHVQLPYTQPAMWHVHLNVSVHVIPRVIFGLMKSNVCATPLYVRWTAV